MQSNVSKALSIAAITSLGACGGSGGGGSNAISAASALNYDPVFATSGTPTVGVALTSTGATGLAVVYDVVNDRIIFENVRVRLSSDGTMAFLSINEGTTITMPEMVSGIYSDNRLVFQFGLTETDDIRDIGSSGQSNGNVGLRQGFIGIETPGAALPMGSTTYAGDFSAGLYGTGGSMGVDTWLGDISIVADFGTGSLGGNLVQGITPVGTISGNTQGNGILGTVTLANSFEYTGEFDIIGKAFGDDGGTLAGVLGGTGLTEDSSGDTYLIYGTFDAVATP